MGLRSEIVRFGRSLVSQECEMVRWAGSYRLECLAPPILNLRVGRSFPTLGTLMTPEFGTLKMSEVPVETMLPLLLGRYYKILSIPCSW